MMCQDEGSLGLNKTRGCKGENENAAQETHSPGQRTKGTPALGGEGKEAEGNML